MSSRPRISVQERESRADKLIPTIMQLCTPVNIQRVMTITEVSIVVPHSTVISLQKANTKQ